MLMKYAMYVDWKTWTGSGRKTPWRTADNTLQDRCSAGGTKHLSGACVVVWQLGKSDSWLLWMRRRRFPGHTGNETSVCDHHRATRRSSTSIETESSATGTRTRVLRVRVLYPNQLDYRGSTCSALLTVLPIDVQKTDCNTSSRD